MQSTQKYYSGIYVHIPFCTKRCHYCSFYSTLPGENEIERYVNSLLMEMKLREEAFQNHCFDTIYIGGGTPSLLQAEQAEAILKGLKKHFNILEDDTEITIEANPESVIKDKKLIQAWKTLGINRVSVGLQSSDDDMLKLLGRLHSTKEYSQAIAMIKEAGIENISTDLIFGLPGQTLEHWQDSLLYAVNSNVSHLSCYALTIDEGTVLENMQKQGEICLPDEDLIADMHQFANDFLRDKELLRYEISNYAKQGYQSRHNKKYWQNLSYLALGAGAHGSDITMPNSYRYFNEPDVEKYIAALEQNSLPAGESEANPIEEQMFECIMLSTRLVEGLDLKSFEKRFGVSFENHYKTIVLALVSNNLALIEEDHFKLTERGMEIQNSILRLFLEAKGE